MTPTLGHHSLIRYQSFADTIVQLFRLSSSGVIASSRPILVGMLRNNGEQPVKEAVRGRA